MEGAVVCDPLTISNVWPPERQALPCIRSDNLASLGVPARGSVQHERVLIASKIAAKYEHDIKRAHIAHADNLTRQISTNTKYWSATCASIGGGASAGNLQACQPNEMEQFRQSQ